MFYCNGNNARSNSNTNIGFRAALPPTPDIPHLLGAVSEHEVIKEPISSVWYSRQKNISYKYRRSGQPMVRRL